MISEIDPKVDYAFKRVFGSEGNLQILAHFLNAVMKPTPGSEIIDLQLLNAYSKKNASDDKLSIVDVRVRDSLGHQFAIETQMLSEPAFPSRILYYWSRLHFTQLKKAAPYLSLRPTISVCIVNFKLFPDFPNFYTDFKLREKKSNIVFSNDIEIITLEVPKFTKSAETIKTPLEQWMYFLRFGDKLDIDNLPETINAPGIHEALEVLQVMSKSRLERDRYEARLKVIQDEQSRLYGAREVGLKEGLKEGLEKGIEQGIEQGRKEEALALVLRQLKKRFGELDAALLTQVSMLDVGKIELLSEALLDFSHSEELAEWLSTH
jgi:predicted transposase/invertase (TIGR01784 family)